MLVLMIECACCGMYITSVSVCTFACTKNWSPTDVDGASLGGYTVLLYTMWYVLAIVVSGVGQGSSSQTAVRYINCSYVSVKLVAIVFSKKHSVHFIPLSD